MHFRTFAAALAATTMLAGTAVYAADEASSMPPPGHAAAVKDFGKLSKDAARGYQDLTLTRLAIFDGRTKDAKLYIDQADASFQKAKADESVFTKAEADLRTHVRGTDAGQATNAQANQPSSSSASNSGTAAKSSDVTAAKQWLPVDGAISVAEDYTAKPAKAAAVADANKSLAKGDRQGAMAKLKLAGVDLDVVTAVVPLQQTLTDVQDAKQMIDGGKYYEGSQKVRAVQDSTIYVTSDFETTPASAAGKQAAQPELKSQQKAAGSATDSGSAKADAK